MTLFATASVADTVTTCNTVMGQTTCTTEEASPYGNAPNIRAFSDAFNKAQQNRVPVAPRKPYDPSKVNCKQGFFNKKKLTCRNGFGDKTICYVGSYGRTATCIADDKSKVQCRIISGQLTCPQ